MKLFYKYEEVILYLIVGVLTTCVSLGVYYGCVLTFLNPNITYQLQTANIISWIVSVTFAYITNRKFVFKSVSKNWTGEAAAFYSSRITTLLMDMAIMFVFVTVCEINDKIIKLAAQVIIMIVNYGLSKWIVFRKNQLQ